MRQTSSLDWEYAAEGLYADQWEADERLANYLFGYEAALRSLWPARSTISTDAASGAVCARLLKASTNITIFHRWDVLEPSTLFLQYSYFGASASDMRLNASFIDLRVNIKEYESDVLLIYNPDDREQAERLGDQLSRQNLRVALKDWDVKPGDFTQEAVEQLLASCRRAAVLVGETGWDSWQSLEKAVVVGRWVVEGELAPIPVLLKGAGRKDLPPFLSLLEPAELARGEKEVRRIADAVSGNVSRRPRRSVLPGEPIRKTPPTTAIAISVAATVLLCMPLLVLAIQGFTTGSQTDLMIDDTDLEQPISVGVTVPLLLHFPGESGNLDQILWSIRDEKGNVRTLQKGGLRTSVRRVERGPVTVEATRHGWLLGALVLDFSPATERR